MGSRLRERGREAQSANELGFRDFEDPDLLREVFGRFPHAVLVTADDRMPEEHPGVIEDVQATIATIEPWDRRERPPLNLPSGLSADEAWKREVVQRWAHAMANQGGGSIQRYSREKRGAWTPRVRNPQGRLFTSSS
jgi:hypothetical protein